MLIKDIQDVELQKLAIKRALEQNHNKKRKEVLEINILYAFNWYNTDEGDAFWTAVKNGIITSLHKSFPEPTTRHKDRELLATMAATIYCSRVTENNIKLSVQSAIELLKEIDKLNKQ
jgi:hypothetical protein